MEKHWVSQSEPSWVFWAHEFSKRATCYSTFRRECYAAEHDDLFDFFETVVSWQRRLPSFRWLSDAGIRPSNKTGYSLSDMQYALTKESGQLPFIGCDGPRYNETKAGKGSKDHGRTEVNELWYYYHVSGTPQPGDARKLDAGKAGGRLTACAQASGAIKYYERTKGGEDRGFL
ncbi:ribonuclease T2 precursor [Metarhizium album ARSEF 1941]|uniref:Ribonuclease T2 n=1 Tax=Metarhizium album (strain ARSEF 1941) TaxID=1081103 RepID=A0A0B2WZ82_METAS|nr:ribonuclease T2 precursor [Metarhizium album ARSEF 1941]KHN98165.1 ribonuclease T2 precursor [Metarhizium album ARSEF 1941]